MRETRRDEVGKAWKASHHRPAPACYTLSNQLDSTVNAAVPSLKLNLFCSPKRQSGQKGGLFSPLHPNREIPFHSSLKQASLHNQERRLTHEAIVRHLGHPLYVLCCLASTNAQPGTDADRPKAGRAPTRPRRLPGSPVQPR